MDLTGFLSADKYPGYCTAVRQVLFRILHLWLQVHIAAVMLANSVVATGTKLYRNRQWQSVRNLLPGRLQYSKRYFLRKVQHQVRLVAGVFQYPLKVDFNSNGSDCVNWS